MHIWLSVTVPVQDIKITLNFFFLLSSHKINVNKLIQTLTPTYTKFIQVLGSDQKLLSLNSHTIFRICSNYGTRCNDLILKGVS